jgi:DNA-binding HxlR family transcriptional regulator
MVEKKKGEKLGEHDVGRMVEEVLKCKWTLAVLNLIRQEINRPGAMVRNTPGLTMKVLNERLQKLQKYNILEREVFPVIPPHVEYKLTDFGKKFGNYKRSATGVVR